MSDFKEKTKEYFETEAYKSFNYCYLTEDGQLFHGNPQGLELAANYSRSKNLAFKKIERKGGAGTVVAESAAFKPEDREALEREFEKLNKVAVKPILIDDVSNLDTEELKRKIMALKAVEPKKKNESKTDLSTVNLTKMKEAELIDFAINKCDSPLSAAKLKNMKVAEIRLHIKELLK